MQIKSSANKQDSWPKYLANQTFRWSWIPIIIYFGIKQGGDPGMPKPTIQGVFWGWSTSKNYEKEALYIVKLLFHYTFILTLFVIYIDFALIVWKVIFDETV